MSEKIIGVTVGTPFNPNKFKPEADEIKQAVDNYLAENPIEGGMTEEQSNQLNKNTEDIATLKEYKAEKKDIPTSLPASDVYKWAKAETKPTYTAEEVGAEPVGASANAANASVSFHNADTKAHSDIRTLVEKKLDSTQLPNAINTALAQAKASGEFKGDKGDPGDVDPETLESAIDNYLKENPIVTEETDPTVPAWAKAETKPTYTAEEVGAEPVGASANAANASVSFHNADTKAHSDIRSSIEAIKVPGKLSDLSDDTTHRTVTDAEKEAWNGKSNFSGSYNDLTNKPTIPTVPTNVSAFTNDKGYVTETDIQAVKDALATNVDKCLSIPDSVNVKVGNEFKIYFKNVITPETVKVWVNSATGLTTKYYEEYLSVTPTAEGDHTLILKLYDDNMNLLITQNLTIKASAAIATGTTTALVIGDSTVAADTMTQKLLDLYTADGATLNLLGTRGTAPNKHEGRGGWHARGYCTKTASEGNAFYNNGFDFSYYMSSQGYSGVQIVVVQLGINDIFSKKELTDDFSTDLNYFGQIVSSIKAYDSDIKIIINLPTTPITDLSKFTADYGTDQIRWLFNRNIVHFAKALNDKFKSYSNVIVSASNCILDTNTHLANGVHPTAEGYNLIGQRLYEVMINSAEGAAEPEALLIDFTARTRVSETVAANATHTMDGTKIYDACVDGRRLNRVTTYNVVSADSIQLQVNGSSGYGVELPLPDLEVGKSYTLNWSADNTNAVIYLMRFNSSGVFVNAVRSTEWTTPNVITPETGYIYSLGFIINGAASGVLCKYSGVSLTEA